MNFSRVVKQTLNKTGLKPSDLARLTGYSSTYIYDLISGERRWNEVSIDKVCKALGLKIKYEPKSR